MHQGLLAEADPLPSPDIETLALEGMVLVLDQITDPHNVGAILRSAAAFAVKAIVTTARHSPEATGVLAKSASGALELVPLVTVQNLARALTQLNERGFMTVGLDSEGSENLSAIELRQPLALVLGAEGKGLRQLTRETCTAVARLDMPGEIKSLNVSNAAVLALYIGATRARADELKSKTPARNANGRFVIEPIERSVVAANQRVAVVRTLAAPAMIAVVARRVAVLMPAVMVGTVMPAVAIAMMAVAIVMAIAVGRQRLFLILALGRERAEQSMVT